MSKGESQQQEQSRGIRKSHRHKVPNPRYIEGINELKKNPLKTRKKGKNSECLNNNHFESEPISKAELQFNQDQLWYPCRLTNNTQIKVQFVIGAEVNYQVPKLDKKRDPLNLLSLVQQTIQNVNGKIIVEEPASYQPKRGGDFQQRKYKPIPRVQLEQDIDGRLISIHIQSNTLKIQHSKMGTYQMPIQTNKCILKMQQENNEEKMRLQSYQQILNKSKILSTITILN